MLIRGGLPRNWKVWHCHLAVQSPCDCDLDWCMYVHLFVSAVRLIGSLLPHVCHVMQWCTLACSSSDKHAGHIMWRENACQVFWGQHLEISDRNSPYLYSFIITQESPTVYTYQTTSTPILDGQLTSQHVCRFRCRFSFR